MRIKISGDTIMRSKPEGFIIESLKISDEKNKWFEGKILADMLNLSDKKCIYYYIRTKKEFIQRCPVK